MRLFSIIFSVLFALFIGLFLFSCIKTPNNPFDLSNTKIFLVGKTSHALAATENLVEDSVGNTITIGFYSNLIQNLDSVQVKLRMFDAKDSMLKVFTNLNTRGYNDTLWDTLFLSEIGTKMVKGVAYINGISIPFIDSLPIVVHAKPLNHKPVLKVTGPTTISSGQQCILTVKYSDPDSLQKDTILLAKAPTDGTLNAGFFVWTPDSSISGADTIVFIAQDNGYPVMRDTAVFIITVSRPIIDKPINRKPVLKVIGATTISKGQSITLTVTASDSDVTQKDSIFLLKGPVGSLLSAGVFTWTPSPSFSGTDSAIFIAQDNGTPIMHDTARAVLTVIDPAVNHAPTWVKDTIVLAGNPGIPISMVLVDKCSDPDNDTLGFALLSGLPANDSIAKIATDPTYIFTAGVGDTGIFYPKIVAKDPKGLSDTVIIKLTISAQHSNPSDLVGPAITKVSGPANKSRTANPTIALVYTIADTSGVDTVSWTLNGAASSVLPWNANNQYSINATLSKSHANAIVVTASDKSMNHNKSRDTLTIDYNRAPIISGAHDTTIEETASIKFTAKATDPDSDKVLLNAPILPTGASFTSGVFSWTPTTSQKGANAIVFKATDGLDTTTDSITITISNVATPTISSQSRDSTKCVGSSVVFSVNATGTGALTYLWKKDGGSLTGAHFSGITTKDLSLPVIAASDSGTYTCAVTNAGVSSVTSSGAVLTVNIPATVTNPTSQTVCEGSSARLTVKGSGTAPLTYQWKKGTTNVGTNSDTLLIASASTGDAGSYTCVVSNSCVPSGVSSSAATLSVNVKTTVTNPVSIVKTVGASATFNVMGFGTGILTYQWKKGNAIVGTNSNTLNINPISVGDAGNYTCTVSGDCGAPITSSAATLTVNCSVIYNGNGNTGGSIPVDLNSYQNAQTVTVIGKGTLIRTGYIFVSWNTAIDDNGTDRAPGSTFSIGSSNVILYAKWKIIQYTVTFSPQASKSSFTQSVDSANLASLPSPSPTLSNCTFAGWYVEKEGLTPWNFSTPIKKNVTIWGKWTTSDYDGNIYNVTTIGDQIWMSQNLRTTHFIDGSAIPPGTDNATWGDLTTPGYCFYNLGSSVDTINKYGALYNWYAVVDPHKIAPTGWHVPTDADWNTLKTYLISNGFNWDGSTSVNKIAKSLAAKTDWAISGVPGQTGNDLSSNNTSTFSAYPSGMRYSGGFSGSGNKCYWWKSVEVTTNPLYAYYYTLSYDYDQLWDDSDSKSWGYSVRLIRD